MTYGDVAAVYIVMALAAGAPTLFLVDAGTPGHQRRRRPAVHAQLSARASDDALRGRRGRRGRRDRRRRRRRRAAARVVRRGAARDRRPRRAARCGGCSRRPPRGRSRASRAARGSSTTRASRSRWPTPPPTPPPAACSASRSRGWPTPAPTRSSIHAKASMAKLFVSEAANRCADRCLQIFGGRGYTRTNVAERFWRELRVDRIWEGTSEIQRLIVARALERRGVERVLRLNLKGSDPLMLAPARRSRSSARPSGPGPTAARCCSTSRGSATAGGSTRSTRGARRCTACRPIPRSRTCPRRRTRWSSRSPRPTRRTSSPAPRALGCGGAVVFAAGLRRGARGDLQAAARRRRGRDAGVRPERQRDRLAARPRRAVGRHGRAARARPGRADLAERQRRRQRARLAPRAAACTRSSRAATRPCSTPPTSSTRSRERDGVRAVALYLEDDGDGERWCAALERCARPASASPCSRRAVARRARPRPSPTRARWPATSASSARCSRSAAPPGPRTRTTCWSWRRRSRPSGAAPRRGRAAEASR